MKEKIKNKRRRRRRIDEREGRNEEIFLLCSVINNGERIGAWLDMDFFLL